MWFPAMDQFRRVSSYALNPSKTQVLFRGVTQSSPSGVKAIRTIDWIKKIAPDGPTNRRALPVTGSGTDALLPEVLFFRIQTADLCVAFVAPACDVRVYVSALALSAP